MSMRFLCGLLMLTIILALECPVWDCKQAGTDKCLEMSNNKVSAGSNCADPDKNVCSLDKYQKISKYQLCSYPEEYEDLRSGADSIGSFMTEKCTANVYYLFNCDAHCSKTDQSLDMEKGMAAYIDNTVSLRSSRSSSRSCYLEKFQSQLKHNSNGLTGWAECTDDHQCASGKCACVPNTNGKGRCTTSFYDSGHYEQLFWQICYYAPNWVPTDFDEYQCYLWNNIEKGHITKAYQEHNSSLPCLQSFNDVDFLLSQVEEPWMFEQLLWIFLGVCFVCAICCAGAVAKQQQDAKKKEEEAAGQNQEQELQQKLLDE